MNSTVDDLPPEAKAIAASVEPDPPEGRPDDLRVFQDMGRNDKYGQVVIELWQFGLMKARWDEDKEKTEVALSDFGVALTEHGLALDFLQAVEGRWGETDMSEYEAMAKEQEHKLKILPELFNTNV